MWNPHQTSTLKFGERILDGILTKLQHQSLVMDGIFNGKVAPKCQGIWHYESSMPNFGNVKYVDENLVPNFHGPNHF
jgi:hypothetical protein